MSNLIKWSESDRFKPNKIIYCLLEVDYEFEDGTKGTVDHKLRPNDRDMSSYQPMCEDPRWVARFKHEFDNNRAEYARYFSEFLAARKLIEEKLESGVKLTKFFTRYYACDTDHAVMSRLARVGDRFDADCEDPVAAMKEVSTWVKHTMVYRG